MNTFLLRRPRGGAAVETALLMLVLVPLIMYTLFLEDLAFYKFDQQETVVSTPWDFADLDYREDKVAIADQQGWAARASMQTFWDHSSAWNTYSNPNHDAKKTDHHQALTAHQCWMGGGQEIACSTQKSVGEQVAGEFNMMNKGGQVVCNAQLTMQNYFLPQKFFEWWAKADMTKQQTFKQESGDAAIHTNAQTDASHAGSFKYPKGEFSVLTDSWALNSMDDASQLNPLDHPSDQGHKFTKWVLIPYGTRDQLLQKTRQFAQSAQSDGFLSGDATKDSPGDDVSTPPVAWKADPDREFGNHTASGWSDNRHRSTQQGMSNSYMGKPESTW